jgi:hypothetical protein
MTNRGESWRNRKTLILTSLDVRAAAASGMLILLTLALVLLAERLTGLTKQLR